jgi:serine/threonine-protein kinase SRPK3
VQQIFLSSISFRHSFLFPNIVNSMIMASLLKWARTAIRRAPSPPVFFSTSGFETISASEVVDEERFEVFKKGHYYPVNIGDVFSSKYQIIGKLGFGVTSTVWLARDLE